MTFTFVPEFVAKTQKPGMPGTALLPVSVPALSHICSHDLPDRTLCPIRAVRVYLGRIDPIRHRSSKHLFVSHSQLHPKDVTKNTISFWIKSVIKDAYAKAGRWDTSLHKITAHELRAFATSLRFSKSLSLSDVMDAASWRGESTFARFYLRDVTHKYLDLRSLGPVVAGQGQVDQSL